MAVHLHPSVVLTAFLGTTVVFGCFSVAALLAKRRSWLYIGGACMALHCQSHACANCRCCLVMQSDLYEAWLSQLTKSLHPKKPASLNAQGCIMHSLHNGSRKLHAGALSSAISLLAMMQLGSWFFGGRQMVFQAELYGGLIIFMGYILVDTQVCCVHAWSVSMQEAWLPS